MNRNKQTEVLGGIITVVILISLIFLSNIENGKLSFLEGFANNVVSPVQNLLISLKTNMDISTVSEILLDLELNGLIKSMPGQIYIRC